MVCTSPSLGKRLESPMKNPTFPQFPIEKVQVGKDQEKAHSEKDSHSKNRDGKKYFNNQVLTP